MKNIVWPLIHKFTLQPSLCIVKYPWGWISQTKIKKFIEDPIPNTKNISLFPEYWEEREFFHQFHFTNGVRMGYHTIFNSYINKDDFTEKSYTTPKLSFAINYLNSNTINKMPNINLDDINVEILGSWIELGNSTSNDKLFGLWDKDYIIHELVAGGLGPEMRYIWDQKPIKQTVRVLYELNNRVDIWDWERCLMMEDCDWKVSNINNILI